MLEEILNIFRILYNPKLLERISSMQRFGFCIFEPMLPNQKAPSREPECISRSR